MSTELAIQPDQTGFSEKQLAALRALGVAGAPAGDIEILFHQAARTGLDPFARQIYLIGRGGKWNIQTGIDGFRVIRDRKGTYQGHVEEWCGPDGVWRDVWLDTKPPAAARVSVHVKGYAVPIVGIARWTEYAQESSPTWKKMPALMLAKCAEALALRKAYPQDLSGLYTDDEIPEPQEPASGPIHTRAPRVTAKPVEAPFDPAPWEDALVEASNLGALRKLWIRAEGERVLDRQLSNGKTLRAVMLATKAHMEQDAREQAQPAQPAQEAQKAPETPQEAVQPVLVPAIDYDDPTPF